LSARGLRIGPSVARLASCNCHAQRVVERQAGDVVWSSKSSRLRNQNTQALLTTDKTTFIVLVRIFHMFKHACNKSVPWLHVPVTKPKFNSSEQCASPARKEAFFCIQCLCAADILASLLMNCPSSRECGQSASVRSRGPRSVISLFHDDERPYQLTPRTLHPKGSCLQFLIGPRDFL
jgi:hypothetical protein